MLHCLIIVLLDNKIKKIKNMRLVRNFRIIRSVPIGKKMPHLRKGKATEYWPGFDKPGQ